MSYFLPKLYTTLNTKKIHNFLQGFSCLQWETQSFLGYSYNRHNFFWRIGIHWRPNGGKDFECNLALCSSSKTCVTSSFFLAKETINSTPKKAKIDNQKKMLYKFLKTQIQFVFWKILSLCIGIFVLCGVFLSLLSVETLFSPWAPLIILWLGIKVTSKIPASTTLECTAATTLKVT